MTDSTARAFACPKCFGVHDVQHLVRYSIGLSDYGPVLMCPDCLSELLARAAEYTAGRALDDFVCDIQVVRTRRATAPAPSPIRAPTQQTRGGVAV